MTVSIVMTIVLAGGGFGVEAAESDLSTSVDGPTAVGPGDLATITVGYHNDGPDLAGSAYVNAYIQSGVPAPIPELTPAQIAALEASIVPDANGNAASLFVDDNYCEHLLFQVQGPGSGPIVGLDVGVSLAGTFDLEIPMEPPEIAAVVIDQPAALAGTFKPAVAGFQWLYASDWGRYTRGGCDPPPIGCADLTNCFGPRLSYIDPIVADFELVDDGTGDPTWGCQDLVGFTPGTIAVLERGGCEFGTKSLKAQNAGAVAAVIVNDLRCITWADSPKCSINMAGGVDGHLVDIPVVQFSRDDGGPVIDALVAGTPVRGRLGPVGDSLTVDATSFLLDVGDLDPNDTNDISAFDVDLSWIFFDGFETGDTTRWNSTVP